jgi:5'-3' exonuclease
MKNRLYIDSQNFIHRARGGFAVGENPIVFNFFRNLRSLIEIHNPVHEVFFVLEGRPLEKNSILPSYKANRKIDIDSSDPFIQEKVKEKENFFRQVDMIHKIIVDHFPFKIYRHPDFECDDTIYNLINRDSYYEAIHHIVISNDSDFIQLLNQFSENVSLYNPMKKMFVERPDFDYAMRKSLTGDSCDNIKGIPGIGQKRADELMNNPEKLELLFRNNSEAVSIFNRNISLIEFRNWSEKEYADLYCTNCNNDISGAKVIFDELSFSSMTKEKPWEKYVNTFKHIDI